MKKSIKFLMLCLIGMITHITVKAQNESSDTTISLKKRIYKISIITSDSKKVNGYIANLSDSNLYLSPSPLGLRLDNSNNYLPSYSYPHLETIEIKRKAGTGRGALKGALMGLAAGVILGFASGDDPVSTYYNPNDIFSNAITSYVNAFRMTAGEKAIAGGIVGAATGALIGALVGTLVKKKFIIGRNKEKFQAMKQNILKKIYAH